MSNIDVYDFNEMIKQVSGFVSNLENRNEALKKELSLLDSEINDLEHYIEFYDVNASKGFMLYKKVQDAMKRRRSVKNEMEYIRVIEKRMSSGVKNIELLKHVSEGVKQVEKTHDARGYQPKVLHELFAQ